MALYNFPNHRKGDTFNGVLFNIKVNSVNLDLTNATVKMDMRLTPTGDAVKSFTSAAAGGITISTPKTDGKFSIDAQIIDIPAATYVYDIEIDLSNGVVKTYIFGSWTILQDITYE